MAAVNELKSGKPLGYVARRLEVNPDTLRRWRGELKKQPTKAFSGHGKRMLAESREGELEQKIGLLTMEIDFLRKLLRSFEEQQEAGNGSEPSTTRSVKKTKRYPGCARPPGVSRAGYYRFIKLVEQSGEEMELRDAIQKIAVRMTDYGYRRITAQLRRDNWVVNRKGVLRIMRADILLCLRGRSFVRTTELVASSCLGFGRCDSPSLLNSCKLI